MAFCLLPRRTYLFEALEDSLHILVPPEEVREGALYRVEVSQGLLLLQSQLLDDALGAHCGLLLVLCEEATQSQKLYQDPHQISLSGR